MLSWELTHIGPINNNFGSTPLTFYIVTYDTDYFLQYRPITTWPRKDMAGGHGYFLKSDMYDIGPTNSSFL